MRINRVTGPLLCILILLMAACAAPSAPTATPQRTSVVTPLVFPVVTQVVPVTPTLLQPTPTIPIFRVPTATPEAQQYDYVTNAMLLSALFPDLSLSQSGNEYMVNGNRNWTMWVNSRAEGRFLSAGEREVAAIIANEAPQISAAVAERVAPWGSFLAILEVHGGNVQEVQRSNLFPVSISQQAFDVKIERVVDFDHDGQNELLVTTQANRLGTSSTAAFLYQWNDQEFVAIWSAPIGDDNTGAINQARYSTLTSDIRFSDADGDGMEEIILDSLRIDYAQDAQGLADSNREIGRTTERRGFRWGGKSFLQDPIRSTPAPPPKTPNL